MLKIQEGLNSNSLLELILQAVWWAVVIKSNFCCITGVLNIPKTLLLLDVVMWCMLPCFLVGNHYLREEGYVHNVTPLVWPWKGAFQSNMRISGTTLTGFLMTCGISDSPDGSLLFQPRPTLQSSSPVRPTQGKVTWQSTKVGKSSTYLSNGHSA